MLTLPDHLHPRTRERVVEWTEDPAVLGVVWVGSRSRGHGDALSDDDLEVLLSPEAFARVAPVDSYVVERDPVADPPRLVFDAQLTTLEALRAKAGSPADLDHWPYERAAVLFERDGSVTSAVRAASIMDPAFRRARIQHAALDLVLAIARARKTVARGYRAATCLLVARGARALARVLFAFEGRWVPLDHWLEPELRSLSDPAVPLLLEALEHGRFEPLQDALVRLEAALEREGFPPPSGRARFFMEVMHASRAAERAIHGLS